MKFKNFTQAYFLIKNNDTFANSLGKRAMVATAGGVLGALLFMNFWPTRIYAHDKI